LCRKNLKKKERAGKPFLGTDETFVEEREKEKENSGAFKY